MKVKVSIILLALFMLLLTACGGDNENSAGGGGSDDATEINVASYNWEFDQETYTASAGEITINHTNEDGFHGIGIEGTDFSINGDGSATVNLEPGEYTIYCNIPCGQGHDDMVATLIVE
ncbi:cytochrome C oxidase subunit II [Evansella sp. AB-P1]|uniref:cytochrome C oxidase subunit II n=1 Tax=Evansella sp. AB-P1 TaxID=3037653 RepID=UPI00241D2AEE|nr:cytochrome C oxidase subunit II [Evansella sp. AB-P1]MDG5787220.1 cytochrome C oxidase subunit II [Evansella sp. AB-P1]